MTPELCLAQAPSSRAAEMPRLPPARHWGNAALVNFPVDTTRCIDANRSVRNGRVGADGESAHALYLDGAGGEAEPGQGEGRERCHVLDNGNVSTEEC